jgi:hypothetical protein
MGSRDLLHPLLAPISPTPEERWRPRGMGTHLLSCAERAHQLSIKLYRGYWPTYRHPEILSRHGVPTIPIVQGLCGTKACPLTSQLWLRKDGNEIAFCLFFLSPTQQSIRGASPGQKKGAVHGLSTMDGPFLALSCPCPVQTTFTTSTAMPSRARTSLMLASPRTNSSALLMRLRPITTREGLNFRA